MKTRIVKKEQQESISRDAPKSTFDSYKKAQAKMKQQILEAPLSTQHTRDVRKRNEALYHSINGSDIKIDSAISHNLNGKALNTLTIRHHHHN